MSARREYPSRFQCGHPGCAEFAHYTSRTQAEQADLYRQYGNSQYRCTRHSRPDEVLTVDAPKRVHEQISRQETTGRYWGNFGFVSGPGFKAWAKDFPPGTILRVTAEVIFPAPSHPQQGEAAHD